MVEIAETRHFSREPFLDTVDRSHVSPIRGHIRSLPDRITGAVVKKTTGNIAIWIPAHDYEPHVATWADLASRLTENPDDLVGTFKLSSSGRPSLNLTGVNSRMLWDMYWWLNVPILINKLSIVGQTRNPILGHPAEEKRVFDWARARANIRSAT